MFEYALRDLILAHLHLNGEIFGLGAEDTL